MIAVAPVGHFAPRAEGAARKVILPQDTILRRLLGPALRGHRRRCQNYRINHGKVVLEP